MEVSAELGINTAWIVKYHVDTIAAYTEYFNALPESSYAAQYIALLAGGFNSSIVSYVNNEYEVILLHHAVP